MFKRRIKEYEDRPEMVEKLRSRVWEDERMVFMPGLGRWLVTIGQALFELPCLYRRMATSCMIAAGLIFLLAGCTNAARQTANSKVEVTRYRGQGYVVRMCCNFQGCWR